MLRPVRCAHSACSAVPHMNPMGLQRRPARCCRPCLELDSSQRLLSAHCEVLQSSLRSTTFGTRCNVCIMVTMGEKPQTTFREEELCALGGLSSNAGSLLGREDSSVFGVSPAAIYDALTTLAKAQSVTSLGSERRILWQLSISSLFDGTRLDEGGRVE